MPKQLDKYELEEEIGRGRFATVYRARDTRLNREVALKIIRGNHANDQQFYDHFQKETQIAAALFHPNLITIHNYGSIKGQLFLDMRYIPGMNLRQLIQERNRLKLTEVIDILQQIVSALEYLHKQQLVHRDLRPQNILLQPTATGHMVTLTDFGMSHSLAVSRSFTKSTRGVGTPAYEAPEQLNPRRWGPLTTATDTYALTIVAYEMLTGRLPFIGKMVDILAAQNNMPPPSPQQFAPDLTDAVVQVLLRGLEKEPAKRYARVGNLWHDLQTALSAQVRFHEQRENALQALQKQQWSGAITILQRIQVEFPELTEVLELLATAEAGQHQADLFEQALHHHAAREWHQACQNWLTILREDAYYRQGEALHHALIALEQLLQSTTALENDVSKQNQEARHILSEELKTKEMVKIPAGNFLYGEERQRLHLPDYWLDKTPVTNAEYAQFVAATNHPPPKHWQGSLPPEAIVNHPVVHVSWFDAREYAAWANKRLPTEQEWEKAARGRDGREYPWGSWQPKRCNTSDENRRSTTTVMSYSPEGDSPYGCADMSGNVWEWTDAWYENNQKMRVLRGGSWSTYGWMARVTNRDPFDPNRKDDDVGFRTAR